MSCDRVPSISLSFSGWVAVPNDVGPVGIDVEVHRPRRNFDRLAAAAFGPEEQCLVTADGAPGFYRIWTLKEAMAKASGTGLAEVADRTDRAAGGPKEGAWRANVGTTPCAAHATPVPSVILALAKRTH